MLYLLVTTSPGGGPKHVYDLVRGACGSSGLRCAGWGRDGLERGREGAEGVDVDHAPCKMDSVVCSD